MAYQLFKRLDQLNLEPRAFRFDVRCCPIDPNTNYAFDERWAEPLRSPDPYTFTAPRPLSPAPPPARVYHHGRRRRPEAPLPPRLLVLPLRASPPRSGCGCPGTVPAAPGPRRGGLPPRLRARDGAAAGWGRLFPVAPRWGRGPRAHGDGAAVPRVRLRALAYRDGQARRGGRHQAADDRLLHPDPRQGPRKRGGGEEEDLQRVVRALLWVRMRDRRGDIQQARGAPWCSLRAPGFICRS